MGAHCDHYYSRAPSHECQPADSHARSLAPRVLPHTQHPLVRRHTQHQTSPGSPRIGFPSPVDSARPALARTHGEALGRACKSIASSRLCWLWGAKLNHVAPCASVDRQTSIGTTN